MKANRTGAMRYMFLSPLFFLLAAAFLAASDPQEGTEKTGTLRVFVSILPQSSLVERIGGQHVSVSVLVEAGKDPHTFELTPKQLMSLGEADVYFGIGFPFEKQLLQKVRRMNPRFLLVETDEGVRRREIETHEGTNNKEAHFHEDELKPSESRVASRIEEAHPHGIGEPDPHIWLAPSALRIICTNIYEGLSGVDGAREPAYRQNLTQLISDLERLDERLRSLLESYSGKAFFVYHPAFGYFADEYGLFQVPVEIEGKSPTPKQIQSLIERARRDGVSIIFVSPQFDRKSASVIAEAIGGSVVSIDPLAKDVLGNLADIAQKIEGALK
jgi:zinc transport system substrate-binding protein